MHCFQNTSDKSWLILLCLLPDFNKQLISGATVNILGLDGDGQRVSGDVYSCLII